MAWHRIFLDPRLLVASFVVALASGVVLMVPYDPDTAPTGLVGWVRGMHVVATLVLVSGAVAHGALRLRTRAAWQRFLTGGAALLAVGVTTTTGALALRTTRADALWDRLGGSDEGTVAAAVLHMTLAALLAAVLVYLHIARRGSRPRTGDQRHLAVVLFATGTVALLPGSTDTVARLLAPDLPVLWAWPMLAGAFLVLAGVFRAAPSR